MKDREEKAGVLKRRRVFGRQVFRVIPALMAVILALAAAAAELFHTAYPSRSGALAGGIAGFLCVYAGAALLIYRRMLAPYQRSREVFKRFIQGETYQELLEQDDLLFEEQEEVFRRFDHMFNKKDIIKASTKQAELLALQNQINPHFLYNTLEAIRGDALCEGLESIADTTEALSTFFRYTITETQNLVTLEEELENAENYFKIQKYRFGEKLKMEVHLPEGEKEVLHKRLPKLTLQPVIENAIFHGLECRAEGGMVSIHVETTEKKLLLSIQDDGVGMSGKKVEEINARLEHISVSSVSENKRGGIALANVCRRIKLLFGEEYGVHVYSLEGIGTDVRVTVPLVEEDV